MSLQPLPWPPLVTDCDVMPHIAADMTIASAGQLTCANSGWPDEGCEIINCNVVSNSEQLQIDLLPCWEYPALWLRSRAINGTPNIQHIFYKDSEIFRMKIGDSPITLNVTLIQRKKLTLGVEVSLKRRPIHIISKYFPPASTIFLSYQNAQKIISCVFYFFRWLLILNLKTRTLRLYHIEIFLSIHRSVLPVRQMRV